MPIFHLAGGKNDYKLQPPGNDEYDERAPEAALTGSARNLLWRRDDGKRPVSSEVSFFISDVMR